MSNPLPAPHDIPLPLPADPLALEIAVVFLFLLHILFVALMVGGSLLTLAYELRGRRDPDLDRLAHEIAKTVTVNKSLAVVLGVGPLLVINALYTVFFYSANALTGIAWLAIVPLVAVAFLLTYAHKYSWETLADRKHLHLALGAAGTALFLIVPLVFLANINLMLFPERWAGVHGFLSTLILPNVLPRYLHFLVASVAVTALFLAGYLGRRGFPAEQVFARLDRATLRREMSRVALGATFFQLVAGSLVLVTLPTHGLSWGMTGNLLAGVALAAATMWLLWLEVDRPAPALGLRYATTCCLLAGTVVFMAYGRHLYREQAIAVHRADMAERTATHRVAVEGARMRAAAGTLRLGRQPAPVEPGERTFRAVCAGCHARAARLVGPPLTEIAQAYSGNPDGVAAWVRAPGRKRADYPPMPAIPLTDEQYRAVAEFVLKAGSGT